MHKPNTHTTMLRGQECKLYIFRVFDAYCRAYKCDAGPMDSC